MLFQLCHDTNGFTGSFAALCCNLLSDPFTSPPSFLFLAFHVISPALTQQFLAAAFIGLVSYHHLPQKPDRLRNAAICSEPSQGLDKKCFFRSYQRRAAGSPPCAAAEQTHTELRHCRCHSVLDSPRSSLRCPDPQSSVHRLQTGAV